MENKIGKYFKYAIGEIILVVIGILIALQVNNWNSNRIIEANQLNLSKRLLAQNKKNIQNLKNQINVASKIKFSIQNLLQFISEDYSKTIKQEVDSLLFNILILPDFDFNSSVLNEALSTSQVANYKNDALKNILYNMPTLFDDTNQRENVSYDEFINQLLPIIYKHTSLRQIDYSFSGFNKEIGKSKLKEKDNRQILSLRLFENVLDNQFYLISRLILEYEKLEQTLQELNMLLENEINDLEK